MAKQDALQSLLVEVGLAMARLRSIASMDNAVPFFRELGYEFTPAMFGGALLPLAAEAGQLAVAVDQLAVATGHAGSIAATQVMLRLGTTVEAIQKLHVQLQAGGGGVVPHFAELPQRLTDFLVLDQMGRRKPELHEALHLLGLIEHESDPAPGESSRLVNWNRLGRLLTEPRAVLNEVYRWDNDFDAHLLLDRLERMMRANILPGGIYPQSRVARAALGNASQNLPELRFPIFQKGLAPETYAQFGITFSPAEAHGGKKAGLALLPYITGATTFGFDVCERGQLSFESTADIRGVGIVVRPPFDAQGLMNLTGPFHAAIRVREKPQLAEEIVLIGTPGGTRLSLQGLGVNWFADGTREKLDLGVEGEIDTVRLIIEASEGDGFLQKVLSGVHVEAKTGIAFGMTLNSGFTFRGGSKLALDLSTHLDVGPVHVAGLRFAVEPTAEGIALECGAVLKFDLGPMKAVAENIGLRSTLRFRPGNLGPANLDVELMPPNGVGLSLDAGGFKGGGFLRFDVAKGEYAGALELDFQGLCTVKAIGIINTKLPDGSPGFSLLILITAEFVPIQLSFGFTLNGVGGLFGLNRTISTDALIEGLRTNAVKSVLFPQDVMANITRIISDIKQFFPAREDRFVVGPMGKLGWGTPSIITAEVGLLLDLPTPMFAIIGVLRAVLPAPEAPILSLQVHFLGELNFDRGYVRFRADLFDSRLLIYAITGSMAFLVSWGEQKTFALSVGGFHPDFREVPAIPAAASTFAHMARIGLSFLSDDNPRLKAESYFAVTSNSVQFGARVELYAGAGGFNVYGFVGYDVLFILDPFHFQADLSGGIALREGTDVIAGINITAKLSGPTPWDARGTATLTILFFDIDVDFHVTWGHPPDAVSIATKDLRAVLAGEYADTRNWRADLPPQNHLHVSLRKLEPPKQGEPLVVHPAGVLTFSQKALPLNGYLIEKFGTLKPLAERQLTLSDAVVNTKAVQADFLNVREQFAPGQFSALSDADKLSRRSFEEFPSGFALTGTASLDGTTPVSRDAEYELSYLKRKPLRIEPGPQLRPHVRTHRRLEHGSSVRRSALAKQQVRGSMNAPPPVALPHEEFVVATTADLTAYSVAGVPAKLFSTEAEAHQYQQSLVRADPALAGEVQVVARYELAGTV